MTPSPVPCSFCGRPCYLGTEHPCCAIERGWGRRDCEACLIAESERRRWERRVRRERDRDA